jgi:hypothetical protein
MLLVMVLLLFSEASKFGGITFPKFTVVTGANPGDFVGGDIICAIISEINWFKKYAHISDEDVLTIYSKLEDRIRGTIGGDKFPCYVYLDSSANDAESPIEDKMTKEIRAMESTFFRNFIRWEVRPYLFAKWVEANIEPGEDISDRTTWKRSWSTEDRPNHTFEVCIGDGATPAFIVKDPEEIVGVNPDLLIRVPMDSRKSFETNLPDSIKDIAGRPTSSESKLIQDINVIKRVFTEDLENIEGELEAGTSSIPERLIWDKIYSKFFIDNGRGRYSIIRAPREPRFVGGDPAHSAKGDPYGLAVMHKELLDGQVIQVVDFSLMIAPDDTGINLEAVNLFIEDLVKLGGLNIKVVAFDQFQSKQTQQNLERVGINTAQFSVDATVEPYQNMVSLLFNDKLKSGRNIYLYNNLKISVSCEIEIRQRKDRPQHGHSG